MTNHWIDEAALGAAKLYLKRCFSGGMPTPQVEAVGRAVDQMALLGYFSTAVSEAITAQGLTLVASGPVQAEQPIGMPIKQPDAIAIEIKEWQLNGKDYVIASYEPLNVAAFGETRKKAIEGLMERLEAKRLEASRALNRCERIMVEDVIALLHQESAATVEALRKAGEP